MSVKINRVFWLFIFYFFFFKAGLDVALAGLSLLILPPLLSMCVDNRNVPPCVASGIHFVIKNSKVG